MGQRGVSQVVHIGRVEDTVTPKLRVVSPVNNDVLTTAEEVVAVVSVTDIGVEEDRHVSMQWIREYQNSTGEWVPLASRDLNLYRDDNQSHRPPIVNSDPDNNYYIYWAKFSDGTILSRGSERNERVRIVSRVKTPNHEVKQETIHEVGMPLSEHRFFKPYLGGNGKSLAKASITILFLNLKV